MSDTEDPRRAWRTDEQWLRLRERITAADDVVPPTSFLLTRTHWLLAAGVVLAAGALTTAVLAARHARAVVPFVVSTLPGQRTTVRLSDSSRVRLGPASSLSYVSTDRERELRLVGIAAFSVDHDAARPFVVRAGNAVTTDVGTEFVVRAYATDTVVEVAVASGAVTVAPTSASGASGSTIILRAGDVGHVATAGTVMRVARSDTAASLAWVDGRLAFTDAEVGDVVADLSRWFDVDIRVPASVLAHRRLSAVYNNPSLDGVLSALSTTLGASYQRVGRTITLSPRSR